MEAFMNQDVLDMQDTERSGVLSTSLNWDWHNPLNVIPLGTLGVIAFGVLVLISKLFSA